MKPTILVPLVTCAEIQLHYKRRLFENSQYINDPETAVNVLRSHIDTNRIDLKEFFWVLLLSNANRLLGISEVAVGVTTGVIVPIREIIQLALLANATGIIAFHNHPSGKLIPSDADKRYTKKLRKSAKLFEINLLDHIIITSESFISLHEEGLF